MMTNQGSSFTLLHILQLTIRDHGQVMGKLEHWFIIDAQQHGVQE